MMRRTPFSEFEELFERMTRGFDDFGRGFEGRGFGHEIALDLAEHDDELVVTVDMPGFEKEDIDVSLSEQTLTISGDYGYESDDGESEYLYRERSHGSMHRSVHLPVEVDEENVDATYTNGVLTITLPKLVVDEDEDTHHIDIN